MALQCLEPSVAQAGFILVSEVKPLRSLPTSQEACQQGSADLPLFLGVLPFGEAEALSDTPIKSCWK